jgi:uncharacterized protein (DUF1778 family)
MAAETNRVDVLLSPAERSLIGRAAAVTGESVSVFMVNAALDRAEQVLGSLVTVTPAEYFDRLVVALDEPDVVPHLTETVTRVRQNPSIVSL